MEKRTRESSLNWENPPLVPKGVINGVAAVVSGKTVRSYMYVPTCIRSTLEYVVPVCTYM